MNEEEILDELPKVWVDANEQFDNILADIVKMSKIKVRDRRGLPNRKEMITLINTMARIFYDLANDFCQDLLGAMRAKTLPISPPSDKSTMKKKKEWNSMIAFLNANAGPISKYVIGSPRLGLRLRRLALDSGALLEFLVDDFADSNIRKHAPTEYKLAKAKLDILWSMHGVKIQAYVNELDFIFQEEENTDFSSQGLLKATKKLFDACNSAWKKEGRKKR